MATAITDHAQGASRHQPWLQRQNPRSRRGFWCSRQKATLFLLEAEAGKLLFEAGNPPGAIHELLLAAGPGRVRLRIDVETERVTLLAPGGAGGELGAVRHDDLDGVVFRVSIGLHWSILAARAAHNLAEGSISRKG